MITIYKTPKLKKEGVSIPLESGLWIDSETNGAIIVSDGMKDKIDHYVKRGLLRYKKKKSKSKKKKVVGGK